MIFASAYCGNIWYYSQILKSESVIIDRHEHFIKQTYRSRCEIYGPNGRQILTVPVHRKNHTPIGDIRIDFSGKWQQEHIRSLRSAYASTPYFEDYESDLCAIIRDAPESLLELNELLFHALMEKLGIRKTVTYSQNFKAYTDDDLRFFNTKEITTPEYHQPFSDRHGFISNLSVLDPLFNEGPEACAYLL